MSSHDPPSSAVPDTSRRVEVDPGRLTGWIDRFAGSHGEVVVRPADGGVVVLTAPDGAVAAVDPPWPCGPAVQGLSSPPGAATGVTDAAAVLTCLAEDVQRARTVGLLLVRRGGFAVGVADGPDLVDGKVGRRHVQGRTKAGGWSQQRYARRRDAQAKEAFAAAADAAVRLLRPRVRDLDGLVTGGDRAAVSAVLADPRLRALSDLPQGRFLAVPDPRRRVLEDAVRRSRAVAIDVFDPLRDPSRPPTREP